MNLLIKPILASSLHSSYVYHYAIDTPCQRRGYIFTEGRFQMFFHVVLYLHFEISRQQVDFMLVGLLNNKTELTFKNFRATFIIETNWKALQLPKQAFLFPNYFCRDEKTHPTYFRFDKQTKDPIFVPGENTKANFVHVDNFHIFMIDKFLLCPQITLNSTEYRVDSTPNKLLIRPNGKPPVYIDYTVVKNEVRVCLVEYDAIMTSSCCIARFSHCLAVALGLSLLL